MDPLAVVYLLLGLVGLVGALVVATRALGTYEALARERIETERMKQPWYQQMAKARSKPRAATSKKSRKNVEPVDEDHPLAGILDNPVARGFAGRYGVDVDALLDGDEGEAAKVEALLARFTAPNGAAGPAPGAAAAGGLFGP